MPTPNDLHDWLQRFLTSKRAANRADNTLITYQYHLALYIEWLAASRLDFAAPETIEAFLVHQREAGYSAHTIAGRYRSLSAWYNYLVKRVKCLTVSPLADLEAPALPDTVRPHVRLGDFLTLFATIEQNTWIDHRDRCILYLLFWCGLRVGELVNLTQGDIDVVRQIVTVKVGKGGKGRLVPCGADLGPLVRDYLLKRPTTAAGESVPGNPLFVSNNGAGAARQALTDNGVRQMLERRCQAANLVYRNPHQFRHGYAMLFLNNGMDLSAVSKTLGHSNESFTSRFYAHWLPEGIKREYADVRRRVGAST